MPLFQAQPLSAVEFAVLLYVMEFALQNLYQPSQAEIARHMNWSSVNAANSVIARLARKGYVRLAGSARALELLPPARALLYGLPAQSNDRGNEK